MSSSGIRKGVIAAAVMAMMMSWVVAMPHAAASGSAVTVRGGFVQTSLFNKCHMVAGGNYKCELTVSGSFNGGIEGSFYWVSKGIWTPDKPFWSVTAEGTIDCDPCTVAGLSGTVMFSTVWMQSTRGDILGTLTVESASGQLAGLTGTGSWSSTAYSRAQSYTAELTLPA